MLFEVQDLAVASPATVSRCGMVYLSFDNLPWMLFVKSWLEKTDFQPYHKEVLEGLFNKSLEKAFKKKQKLYEPFPSTLIQCATNICNILQSLKPQMKLEVEELAGKVLTAHFIFAFIWGLGGGVSNVNNAEIQSAIEDTFSDFTFPRSECVFDHMIHPDTQQSFISWTTKVP
jgi:dynein heavy chain